jgi:hypothetical protein
VEARAVNWPRDFHCEWTQPGYGAAADWGCSQKSGVVPHRIGGAKGTWGSENLTGCGGPPICSGGFEPGLCFNEKVARGTSPQFKSGFGYRPSSAVAPS